MVALLLPDSTIALDVLRANPLFTLLSVILSASLLVVIIRIVRPQFYFERGSALIFLVCIAGLLSYLYGSYVGEFSLHWLSLPLIYLGFVGYLAGKRATVPLVPPIIGIAILPLSAYVSSSIVSIVSIGILATLVLPTYAVLRFKRSDVERCEYCKTYVGKGRTFCDYCGKNLYPVRFELTGKRLAKSMVASFLIILLFSVSVTSVALSNSGMYISHYSLAGERSIFPLLSLAGLKDTLTSSSSNSTLTILDYSLMGSHGINATISLSPSPSLSFSGALEGHRGAKQNGSIEISPNQSGVLFNWGRGKTRGTGLLLSNSLTYLSSGRVHQGYATFLLSEDSSSFERSGGGELKSISLNLVTGLQASKPFEPFVVDILGPILSYDQYVFPVGALMALGMVTGIARNIDFSNSRKFDNSLGLDEREFAAFASLPALKGKPLGSDLLESNGTIRDWQALSALLEKLSMLGIMERRIATKGGIPRLFWKCTVTW